MTNDDIAKLRTHKALDEALAARPAPPDWADWTVAAKQEYLADLLDEVAPSSLPNSLEEADDWMLENEVEAPEGWGDMDLAARQAWIDNVATPAPARPPAPLPVVKQKVLSPKIVETIRRFRTRRDQVTPNDLIALGKEFGIEDPGNVGVAHLISRLRRESAR